MKKTTMTIKMDKLKFEKIKNFCRKEGRFINKFFEIAIENEIKRRIKNGNRQTK